METATTSPPGEPDVPLSAAPDTRDRSQFQLHAAVVALGIVLVLPSLWAGLYWDDYPMAQSLSAWLSGAGEQAWWDIFLLDSADPTRRFGGRIPWWSVDVMYARFFRPVSALTHLIDYRLWPQTPMVMHAQSIVWFALLIGSVLRFYAKFLPPRAVALAGALFASSYVHAIPVGWLSNRNAIIAATFGFLSAAAYIRWRDRNGLRRPWAPLLLLLSLLSSEAGVATVAVVVAFEFTVKRKGHQRGPKLAAMVLVLILWRAAYSWAGFGALGSGSYIDPAQSPGLFLSEAGPRLAWLLGFLLAPLRLLIARGMPNAVIYVCGFVFAAAAALVLREALRPEHRLWSVSTLLCLIPALAAAPGERLLVFAVAVLSPVLAASLGRQIRGGRLSKTSATALILTYCVASPSILFLGSFDQSYNLRQINEEPPRMASISDDELRGKNVFILHAPDHGVVHTMKTARRESGLEVPAFTWNLFPTDSPPLIQRLGCCSLELEHTDGMSRGPFVVYFRGLDSPMQVGETVETLAFTAEVLGVTKRGVPTKVRFTLKEPLESYRNLFVTWNGDDFERVDPSSI